MTPWEHRVLTSPAAGHPLRAAPAAEPGQAAAGGSCRLPAKAKPPGVRGAGPDGKAVPADTRRFRPDPTGEAPGKDPPAHGWGLRPPPLQTPDRRGPGLPRGQQPCPPRSRVARPPPSRRLRPTEAGSPGPAAAPGRRYQPRTSGPQDGQRQAPAPPALGSPTGHRHPGPWHPAPGLRTRGPGTRLPGANQPPAPTGPGTRRPRPRPPALTAPAPPRSPAVPGGAGRWLPVPATIASGPCLSDEKPAARPAPPRRVTPSAANGGAALTLPREGRVLTANQGGPPATRHGSRQALEGGGLPRAGCSRTAPPPAAGRRWGGGGAAGGAAAAGNGRAGNPAEFRAAP